MEKRKYFQIHIENIEEEEKSWEFQRNATHTRNCCVQDVSIDHSPEYSLPFNWQETIF